MGAKEGNGNAKKGKYPRNIISVGGPANDKIIDLLIASGIKQPTRSEVKKVLEEIIMNNNDALGEAQRILQAKQAAQELEDSKLREMPRRRTQAELDAAHVESRARNLLHDGLEKIKEGKKPTRTQMPFVQAYLAGHRDEIQRYKKIAEDAHSEREYNEHLYSRIVTEWNDICVALREIGIESFHNGDSYGYRGIINGEQVQLRKGYASYAEVIKAALSWRVEQAKQEM